MRFLSCTLHGPSWIHKLRRIIPHHITSNHITVHRYRTIMVIYNIHTCVYIYVCVYIYIYDICIYCIYIYAYAVSHVYNNISYMFTHSYHPRDLPVALYPYPWPPARAAAARSTTHHPRWPCRASECSPDVLSDGPWR